MFDSSSAPKRPSVSSFSIFVSLWLFLSAQAEREIQRPFVPFFLFYNSRNKMLREKKEKQFTQVSEKGEFKQGKTQALPDNESI